MSNTGIIIKAISKLLVIIISGLMIGYLSKIHNLNPGIVITIGIIWSILVVAAFKG